MVLRPFKNPPRRALLLALAAMSLMAVQTRGQTPPPLAPAQFDPSDVYFQGYLATRAAEKLQAQGDFLGATEKLEQARKLLAGVQKYFPDWKKEMVTGRAAITADSIEKIRPQAEEQRRKKQGAVAELEGSVKTPGRIVPAPASDPQPGVLDADPLAARKLAEAQAEVQRLRNQLSNSNDAQRDAQLRAAEANAENLRARLATSPMQSDFNALEKRIAGLEQEKEAMGRALAESRAAHTDTLSKVAILEADLSNLRKEADGLRQKQANTERDLKKERSVANEVVAGMRRQMDALEGTLKNKTDELAKANEKIAGLQLELKQSHDAFGELRNERDNLLRERDQMAGLLKLNEAGRINQLIEQNMGLAKDLREAKEKVESLSLDGNAAKDELLDAKRDLGMVKARIIQLQDEKRAQNQRITELEERLKGEESALAKGEASADPAEVAVLRDIIKRQLLIQERRRQARDIIVEAVKNLGTQDEKLASAIQLFDGQEIQLTVDEQKLIADRQVDGDFISPFAKDRATVDKNTAGLNADLASYDRAATKAFAADRYHPARELFQMIVEANPGNSSALCKLGVVNLRLQDADAASKLFRKAVELEESNPYAHRMLGLSLMTLGDLSGAEQNVSRSVDLAPDDATSQALLAGISFRLGKYGEAESHYKAAILADPIPSEPYINLALIYARKNKLEEARKYYDQALERGALPDMKLEKLMSVRKTNP